jgi:hypothetical protein
VVVGWILFVWWISKLMVLQCLRTCLWPPDPHKITFERNGKSDISRGTGYNFVWVLYISWLMVRQCLRTCLWPTEPLKITFWRNRKSDISRGTGYNFFWGLAKLLIKGLAVPADVFLASWTAQCYIMTKSKKWHFRCYWVQVFLGFGKALN